MQADDGKMKETDVAEILSRTTSRKQFITGVWTGKRVERKKISNFNGQLTFHDKIHKLNCYDYE